MKKFGWYLFAFFALTIGFYPIVYVFLDMSHGLLGSKSKELLSGVVWPFAFYTHIYLAGLALICGWSQFSKKIRNKYLAFHKLLGKIYLLSVSLSGLAGLYMAFFATGGTITGLGFGCLALLWLATTAVAYSKIRQGEINDHEKWMIRSYALCFAGVTLRLWMPLFQAGFHFEFLQAYKIVAWLCWIPNIIVAEIIVRTKERPVAQ